MSVVETFASAHDFQSAPTSAHWPEIKAADYSRQKPDLHLVNVESGEPNARCSIWWQNTPPYQQEKVGVIGHYAANSQQANDALLDAALKALKEQGCTLAIGPMDGNTWNKYRLITWSNGHPPFFFDIEHPAEWPIYLHANGFTPLLQYQTRLNNDLSEIAAQSDELHARIEKSGITLRSIDMTRVEQELEAVYDISTQSFTASPFYVQQEKAAFMQQYASLLPQIHPELAILAQVGSAIVGFTFAVPDFMQKMRGEKIDTIVSKTTAVLPTMHGKGIGTILSDWYQYKAYEMGFKKAIHAFMYEDNTTRRMSARVNSELIRRYSLFSKRL